MKPGNPSLPQPGEVIRYAYLWASEAEDGREESSKDRPCAVVLALHHQDDDDEVLVLPVTSRQPENPEDGIEVPIGTRRRLGLQEERCWILLSELNRFVWPGPDLRPVEKSSGPFYSYGPLPAALFLRLRIYSLRALRISLRHSLGTAQSGSVARSFTAYHKRGGLPFITLHKSIKGQGYRI